MLRLWVEFFEDLQFVRGRSANTVSAYRRDLSLYEEFSKTGKSISAFYAFMKDKGLSVRSQARMISSLRTYFKFLERNDIEVHELRELKLPKVHKKPPKTIGIEEFESLLKASKDKTPWRSQRNHLALYLMFGLGLRVTELISLDLESLHLDEGSLIVKGKGDKERILPLNEGLSDQLTEYLEEHRPELCSNPQERALLINNKSNRPSRVDIWRWLGKWSKLAGFKERVHPHQFRHACATSLLENGAHLRSIQILLGHTSLQTTQIYTQVAKKHLNKTLEEHHPFAEKDFVSDLSGPHKD